MQTPYEYKPIKFYILTFLLTWGPWLFAIKISQNEATRDMGVLVALFGLIGPTIAALIMIFTSGNAALKSDFKDRMINFKRLVPKYVLVILLMAPMVMFGSIGISVLFGEPVSQFVIMSSIDQYLVLIIIAVILAPLMEETGWRGYGVDSLRAKMGTLKSSILFSLLWSIWHLPLIFVVGSYQWEVYVMDNPLYVINFFASIIPVGIIANWIYYKNNRFIIAGIAFHSMLNVGAMIPDGQQPAKCIVTLVYLIIAFLIIRYDREAFDSQPRNYLNETE